MPSSWLHYHIADLEGTLGKAGADFACAIQTVVIWTEAGNAKKLPKSCKLLDCVTVTLAEVTYNINVFLTILSQNPFQLLIVSTPI